ncbi:hypothetical protein PFISCL1PPCAC_17710, partial [Pristionchus fissidentatus]
QCGEYDSIANPTDQNKPCFKIHSDEMNWKDAEKKCSDDFGSLATINSDEALTNQKKGRMFGNGSMTIQLSLIESTKILPVQVSPFLALEVALRC